MLPHFPPRSTPESRISAWAAKAAPPALALCPSVSACSTPSLSSLTLATANSKAPSRTLTREEIAELAPGSIFCTPHFAPLGDHSVSTTSEARTESTIGPISTKMRYMVGGASA
ncbi:hypothetical protein BU16DRAFT_566043 [Lophium mytilinum]|uniref:Uncharacterized protein n=1 Tax=Lophium mytilinum TaxID=390894 RepID=A0A6A6QGK2_9PEZI|nr:hypothetical protein BU16DRAFT_566043 [Lophium mytilinum]